VALATALSIVQPMIELAPSHKCGLSLKGPIMPATGVWGYSDAYRRLIPMEALGAVVTNPITARPRQGARPPRAVETPGGLLLHTGLHNPGVAAVIRRHHRRWAACPVPVIAHVVGVNVDEARTCVERLGEVEAVTGVELGLPDSLTVEEALEIISAARDACTLPLIVKLPLWRAAVLSLRIADLGCADALTVAAPPRGTAWHRDSAVTGRLYGPATFPQALWALRQVVDLIGNALPLIGCGGVHSVADALAMLRAGAVAVQVDGYLWKDPAGFVRLAREVTQVWGEPRDGQGLRGTITHQSKRC
jgi:dihydroorotate dehydrogenase (NAD+) catalytic subunit